MPTAVESTAVEAAGLAKRSLYELEPARSAATPSAARASPSMRSNEGILALIKASWGRR